LRTRSTARPLLTSATLDAFCGGQLFFKCENFQKIGAFKARGGANAVFSLSDAEAARGVATHSSGNHAAALARAARLRGIPAHIVMPSNAPKAKVDSVRRNGGIIVFCEPDACRPRDDLRQGHRGHRGAARPSVQRLRGDGRPGHGDAGVARAGARSRSS